MVKISLGPGPNWKALATKKAGTVDEIVATHVLQYLAPAARKAFANAAHKALKKGGKLITISPSWSAQRAYADIDVVWPPIAEGWFYYLNAEFRAAQPVKAAGYTCDFEVGVGYGMHQAVQTRNFEYQSHAIQFWKEAAQDIYTTLTKR